MRVGHDDRRGCSLRCASPSAGALSIAALSLALLCGATPVAAAVDSSDGAAQDATRMDQMDLSTPQAQSTVLPAAEKAQEWAPFFRDTKIGVQLRTYYFNRENYDDSRSEAWAVGGSISYKSGYLFERLALGAVGYTSQPVSAPEDHDGTLLLKPDQEGYTVLGQIYGEVKLADRIVATVGRTEFNTPYLNKNDTRMTPNTFEAVAVSGTAGGKDGAGEWRFGGGYVTKIKERNSDDFTWVSVDAGAKVDRGVAIAGMNYKAKDFSLGAIDYYSEDVINILYAEGKYGLKMGERFPLNLAAQYTDQRSTGDDLLTGSSFETYQWGLKGDLSFGAATLTVAYTDTDSEKDVINPWSNCPGYTSAQVKDFNRAGESAVMVKGAYDFSGLGLAGVSAYALYVHGTGREAPAYDEDEIDFNLQWTPKAGILKGTSLRLRYARVMQDGGGDPDINEVRAILNYDF